MTNRTAMPLLGLELTGDRWLPVHSPHHDTAATSCSLTPSMGKVNKHTVLAVPFLMELGKWEEGKSSSMETQDWQQRKGASEHWAMKLLAARVSTSSPEQVPHAMPKAKGETKGTVGMEGPV